MLVKVMAYYSRGVSVAEVTTTTQILLPCSVVRPVMETSNIGNIFLLLTCGRLLHSSNWFKTLNLLFFTNIPGKYKLIRMLSEGA